VVTSTRITGSSTCGAPAPAASRKPIDPAILNAISFESTSWYEPSTSFTLRSTIG
jgi:hypothetical protein